MRSLCLALLVVLSVTATLTAADSKKKRMLDIKSSLAAINNTKSFFAVTTAKSLKALFKELSPIDFFVSSFGPRGVSYAILAPIIGENLYDLLLARSAPFGALVDGVNNAYNRLFTTIAETTFNTLQALEKVDLMDAGSTIKALASLGCDNVCQFCKGFDNSFLDGAIVNQKCDALCANACLIELLA